MRLFIWNAGDALDAAWIAAFARTRAAELRAYVLAFDRSRGRAFAVDPDGTVLCGTFGDFAMSAFAFDRTRTDRWRVATATDVREGLVRIDSIARRRAT